MTDATLLSALDELVPAPCGFGDWDDVLLRANIRSVAPAVAPRRRRLTRRRGLVAAIVMALLVIFFASPALGLLLDLIGRTDVTFTGTTAPTRVKRSFFDMSLSAPRSMSPGTIASETRRIGVFRGVKGRRRVLYVAPTRAGGYCWEFEHDTGSCRSSRKPYVGHGGRGSFRAERIGVTWGLGQHRGGPLYVQEVSGDVIAAAAQTLWAEYADGTRQPIPFVWVSKPIDAGFFMLGVSAAHETVATRLVAVSARDGKGRLLSREAFQFQTRPAHPPVKTPPTFRLPPPLPAPTPPLQRGSAAGVTVTVGANHVAVFETSDTQLRKASWACFKFMRYHQAQPFETGWTAGARHGRDRIDLNGMPTPVDGCEIQGDYGHTWPDRNNSHSPVEIAFSARGRRYFENRAAARDLGVFIRTRRSHSLDATTRIHVSRSGAETTFTEMSSTGRRFFVTLRGDRIVRDNVRAFAYVR